MPAFLKYSICFGWTDVTFEGAGHGFGIQVFPVEKKTWKVVKLKSIMDQTMINAFKVENDSTIKLGDGIVKDCFVRAKACSWQ